MLAHTQSESEIAQMDQIQMENIKHKQWHAAIVFHCNTTRLASVRIHLSSLLRKTFEAHTLFHDAPTIDFTSCKKQSK